MASQRQVRNSARHDWGQAEYIKGSPNECPRCGSGLFKDLEGDLVCKQICGYRFTPANQSLEDFAKDYERNVLSLIPLSTCKECGEGFRDVWGRRDYCVTCQYLVLYGSEPVTYPRMKVCELPGCNEEFYALSWRQKFHSPECRRRKARELDAARYKKRKEARVAAHPLQC